MKPTILLELIIRSFCYLCAFLFLVTPRGLAVFGRQYRALIGVLALGLALSASVGWYGNPWEKISFELVSATVLPAGIGLCGFVATRRIGDNAQRIAGIGCLLIIIARLITMTAAVDLFGLIKSESTILGYMVAFIGPIGLILMASGKQPLVSRGIIAGTWLASVFSMHKWNLVMVVVLPIIWISMEGRGKLKLAVRVGALVMLALVAYGVADSIDTISETATGADFDDYLDHHFRRRSDTSSGRFEIWQGQIDVLMEAPFAGIGLGTQSSLYEVADHDAYVFFLTRFGVILGPAFLLILFYCGRTMVRCSGPSVDGRRIALFLVLNAAFVISVGEAYTFSPVVFIIGIGGGLLMRGWLNAPKLTHQYVWRTLESAHSVPATRLVPGRVGDQSGAPAPGNAGLADPSHGGALIPVG